MKFAMFFLGEYVSVLMTAAMITVLFLGGWLGPAWLPPLAWFLLKTAALVLSMILIRGALPRPRYDQLMAFGWKLMLPLALINLLATGALTLM
jgi:NADH-quinone oxidoreductase subunit H